MERLTAYGMNRSEFSRQTITVKTIKPIITVSPVNDELLAAVGRLTGVFNCGSDDGQQPDPGLTYANAETLPPESVAMVEMLLTTLAGMFLWSGFERITTVALHMSLSVLVFASVRTNRRWLYPAAILIHTAVDFAAVIVNSYLPVAATELLVLVLTAVPILWAARIYSKLSRNTSGT